MKNAVSEWLTCFTELQVNMSHLDSSLTSSSSLMTYLHPVPVGFHLLTQNEIIHGWISLIVAFIVAGYGYFKNSLCVCFQLVVN